MKQGQPQICSLSTLAAISTIYCHCGIFVFSWPLPQTVLRQIPHPALSTTAAFPAIQCRCGESVCMTPVLEADQGSFPSIPLPTTAEFPAIRCRCGKTISPPPFQLDALRRIQPEYPPHHKPNDRLESTPNISYLYDIKSFSP